MSENHPEFSCPEVPVMGGKGWCLYRLPHDVLCALKAHYPPRTFVPGQREAWTVMGAECATVSSSSSRDLGWGEVRNIFLSVFLKRIKKCRYQMR